MTLGHASTFGKGTQHAHGATRESTGRLSDEEVDSGALADGEARWHSGGGCSGPPVVFAPEQCGVALGCCSPT
eukprot:6005366-Prymnesium_polylepis.1